MSVPGPVVAATGGQHAEGRVALVTLGCARNEVDSEELAARLARDGWEIATDPTDADVVLVNTCGFIAKAKQDSIEVLLDAVDGGAKVVATGCLAERYGADLAESLPEVAAVLGFDQYPDIAARVGQVLAGQPVAAHRPRDRRTLPLVASGAAEPAGTETEARLPAHLRTVVRYRLDQAPVAPLKIANGCDRRCAFCAIPSFRGAFASRQPDEVLAEAAWLSSAGVRELVLVSENSTSYGKDLGDPRMLEKLIGELATIDGIARVRVSYLQPAEVRPSLVEAIATTPGVASYFDLSFQHSSEPVLRRMRRFGSTERFLDLLASIRALDPEAGVRSNVILGFPGETRGDVTELERFLAASRLDAIGVFDYSDEDGTEAAGLSGKVSSSSIARRYARLSALADQVGAQRAAERVGSTVEVLVDLNEAGGAEGRAAHQAPEVDGSTTLVADGGVGAGGVGGTVLDPAELCPGDLVRATVIGSTGVDLIAVPVGLISSASKTVQSGGERPG
ncbi:MAG: 30S ribosomal protein S12 methylthiotransferase RimO [Dactylosporangium sp.]|nr:30S ribosomal protein S12 methylthiotransferase RimO [Dactylosporangium sp.]NNJ61789.1 30S ribosomal protein S12 methylthiotransferase RimO [Dactylosporangium sp.]